jgi:hypothetical protein
MSFQFAGGRADGLLAAACNADKVYQSDRASVNS